MMKGIIKTEGVTGLYRGLPGIWIKDIPGSFLYFGSYELAKSTIRHFKQSQHLGKFLFIKWGFICRFLCLIYEASVTSSTSIRVPACNEHSIEKNIVLCTKIIDRIHSKMKSSVAMNTYLQNFISNDLFLITHYKL